MNVDFGIDPADRGAVSRVYEIYTAGHAGFFAPLNRVALAKNPFI